MWINEELDPATVQFPKTVSGTLRKCRTKLVCPASSRALTLCSRMAPNSAVCRRMLSNLVQKLRLSYQRFQLGCVPIPSTSNVSLLRGQSLLPRRQVDRIGTAVSRTTFSWKYRKCAHSSLSRRIAGCWILAGRALGWSQNPTVGLRRLSISQDTGIFPTVSYWKTQRRMVRSGTTEARKGSSYAKHCILLIPLAAGNGFKKIPLPAPTPKAHRISEYAC